MIPANPEFQTGFRAAEPIPRLLTCCEGCAFSVEGWQPMSWLGGGSDNPGLIDQCISNVLFSDGGGGHATEGEC